LHVQPAPGAADSGQGEAGVICTWLTTVLLPSRDSLPSFVRCMTSY